MTEIRCRGGEHPEMLTEAELEGVRSSMWSHDATSLVPRLVATLDFYVRWKDEFDERS